MSREKAVDRVSDLVAAAVEAMPEVRDFSRVGTRMWISVGRKAYEVRVSEVVPIDPDRFG